MEQKELLIKELTITLADICNVTIKELEQIIANRLYDYSVTKIETTLPSTCDGSATMYIFKEFAQAKFNQGMDEKTLSQYKYSVKQFFEFTGKEINNCDYHDINNYLTHLRQKNLKSQTIRNKYQLLSSVYNFMYDFHFISDNPINRVAPPKVEITYKKPITKQEEEQIKIVCEKLNPKESARSLAIFNFLLDTGCRVSEMCNVNISDIDFINREVHIRQGKGGKDRVVMFTEKTTVRLKEYFKYRPDINVTLFGEDIPLFINIRGNNRIQKASVEDLLKEIGMLAGVSRLQPHLLRATFATRLVEKDVPLNVVAEMLGHANLHTIDRYVRITTKNKKRYLDMAA